MRIPALCLCLTLAVLAQQRKAAPPKPKPAPPPPAADAAPVFPVVSLRVTGSKLYPQEKLVELTGLKMGEPGDKKRFDAARDRLVASGAFESVAYQFGPDAQKQGYIVTFEVADIEQVYPVRFDRLPAADTELRAALASALPLFAERIPGTKELIEKSRAAIQAFLASKGGKEEVRARLTSDRPDELYILIHAAGASQVVAEVAFRGNKTIPAQALQAAIHGVAVGIEYREQRFRELLDTSIRPLYEARGRVRVAFPKIEAAPSEGVRGLKITVELNEGESYSFGSLRVEGAPSMAAALVKAADLTTGDLANFDVVKAAQQRIHSLMRANGYMRVASTIEPSIDDAKKIVDVTVRLTPGPEYRFGKLTIQGLDVHGEHEIKRIWGLDPGKRFNAGYPDHFLNRIREDRIFEQLGKTTAVLTPDDANLTVDVTLVFGKPEPVKPPKVPGQPDR